MVSIMEIIYTEVIAFYYVHETQVLPKVKQNTFLELSQHFFIIQGQKKKEEIWHSPMTKAPTLGEMSKE